MSRIAAAAFSAARDLFPIFPLEALETRGTVRVVVAVALACAQVVGGRRAAAVDESTRQRY